MSTQKDSKLQATVILQLVIIFSAFYVSSPAYTNQFVVQLNGGPEAAKELARKYGFVYLGEVLQDFYHLQHRKVAKRSAEISHEHHLSLQSDPKVKWFSQQVAKRRVKRDLKPNTANANLNDPRWPHMWYLNRGQGLDMNVQEAWKEGATGKGIVVTILDDGLEKDHPDIKHNYDPDASYDVNNQDADPQPRYDFLDSNRHGTRCAGEVAASANNSLCSVGVAYQAKVGGVKMLDGDVTDAVEARSIGLNSQHIDIYSASWGPDDDGKTVDGPGALATKAFEEGIKKGRKGLGSVFVWASGNGGREKDNCNCDGYTNSIWTLSISSATENGLVPWYSEACSSTLASTYSSGSSGERQIITTDLHHGCTSSHTGTSASAPLAAGICALALEANKNLTWRDMQHIVVRTARPAHLFARDWKTNGVGRNVSHSFGYGMMDAAAMVRLARIWKTVPPQKHCEVRAHHMDRSIYPKTYLELSLEVHCDNVRYLEHVQATVTLLAPRRGDIIVYLTSPLGTRSTLLAQRPMDNSRSGFRAWPFMTVHNWGENPNGLWKLEIYNAGQYLGRAALKEWTLLLYGTTTDPENTYNMDNNIESLPSVPIAHISQLSPVSVSDDTSIAFQDNLFPKNDVLHIDDNNNQKSKLILEQHNNNPITKNPYSSSNNSSGNYPCVSTSISLCVGCSSGWFLLDGKCVTACPDGLYGANQSTPNLSLNSATCHKCHYSCKTCTGPNDYNCETCFGDAVLWNKYCHPKTLLEELLSFSKWYLSMTLAFVVLCFVLLGLAAYLLVDYYPFLISYCTKKPKYTSLPTTKPNDHHQTDS